MPIWSNHSNKGMSNFDTQEGEQPKTVKIKHQTKVSFYEMLFKLWKEANKNRTEDNSTQRLVF